MSAEHPHNPEQPPLPFPPDAANPADAEEPQNPQAGEANPAETQNEQTPDKPSPGAGDEDTLVQPEVTEGAEEGATSITGDERSAAFTGLRRRVLSTRIERQRRGLENRGMSPGQRRRAERRGASARARQMNLRSLDDEWPEGTKGSQRLSNKLEGKNKSLNDRIESRQKRKKGKISRLESRVAQLGETQLGEPEEKKPAAVDYPTFIKSLELQGRIDRTDFNPAGNAGLAFRSFDAGTTRVFVDDHEHRSQEQGKGKLNTRSSTLLEQQERIASMLGLEVDDKLIKVENGGYTYGTEVKIPKNPKVPEKISIKEDHFVDDKGNDVSPELSADYLARHHEEFSQTGEFSELARSVVERAEQGKLEISAKPEDITGRAALEMQVARSLGYVVGKPMQEAGKVVIPIAGEVKDNKFVAGNIFDAFVKKPFMTRPAAHIINALPEAQAEDAGGTDVQAQLTQLAKRNLRKAMIENALGTEQRRLLEEVGEEELAKEFGIPYKPGQKAPKTKGKDTGGSATTETPYSREEAERDENRKVAELAENPQLFRDPAYRGLFSEDQLYALNELLNAAYTVESHRIKRERGLPRGAKLPDEEFEELTQRIGPEVIKSYLGKGTPQEAGQVSTEDLTQINEDLEPF
jgi:hypothetical protein